MQSTYHHSNLVSLSPSPRDITTQRHERQFLLAAGAIALILLACLLRPGMNLGNIFPRVSLVGSLFAAAISLRIPRLALPTIIVMLAPLYALGKTVGQVSLGGYPLSVLSIAIWGLGLYYTLVWRTRRVEVVQTGLQRKARNWLLLIMLASIPALWMVPGKGNDPFITVLIFFAGSVEPLVLFLCIATWLKYENNPGLLVKALLLSCVVAVLVGQVNLSSIQYDAISMDSSALRYNLTGFGGANLTGYVLVSIYPLSFLLLKQPRLPLVWGGGAVVLLWGIAIFSLSRATPLVMGIQTLAFLVIAKNNRMQVLGLMGLIGAFILFMAIAFPDTYFDMWVGRLREINLQAFYQKDFHQVTSSDAERMDLQQRLIAEICQRPLGGYAATAQEDPEGLYLDTALQLGWIPAFSLLCLHISMFSAAAKRWKQREGALGLCIFLGVLLYGLTTGVNLAKAGGDATQQYGYGVNALPTLCNVIVLAIATYLLATKSKTTSI